MTAAYDVAGIGNAIVDIISPATDDFIVAQGLNKGGMKLVDEESAGALYDAMAPGLEASGGSAANSLAGLASLGGRGAFMGKVASDQLGEVFAHDIRAMGVKFDTPFLDCGPATGKCLINVTPDGQRTMTTYLGAAALLSPPDVNPETVKAAEVVYLEGYLFDPGEARNALLKASRIAREAGRKVALTLSDAFVVERWRDALLAFLDEEVDLLFANEVELTALFETGSDFDAALQALKSRVAMAAVTRGAQGSVILHDGEVFSVPADPVDRVVDTTGAGDQYAAGFLFGLARRRPLPECGRLGSIAAAEVISHYGPRPQVSLSELVARCGLSLSA
ncbi:MAG TPA: adenosine kinase [Caulobacteraceae bacterium]